MKLREFISKNKAILFIVFLAFILRIIFLDKNLFFGFEQGRDFLKVREILSGNLTLIGPKTDIDGVFHGAFSYYILAIPFLVFKGNPYLVQVFFILVNSIAIIFLYKSVKELFDKRIGLITSLLYAISYSAIIYARWLSNPTLVPALTIMIFYFLIQMKKNSYFLIPLVVLWSVAFHLELVAAVTLVPGILFYIFSQKVKLPLKVLVLSFISILILFSPYLIFNFKHDNILINSITRYISTKETKPFSELKPLDEFSNEIVDNFYPVSKIVPLIIFWSLLIIALISNILKKNKVLFLIMVFLFTGPLCFYLLKTNPLRHFYVTVPVFLSVIAAYSISFLIKKKLTLFGLIILVLIIFGNLMAFRDRLPKSTANFLYHAQHMYIGDQKNLLDYIYKDASGKEFSYEYYSIPYWKNEAWVYLFTWYGKDKYGYSPSISKTKTFYVLIEPDESQPLYQENWYKGMNENSTLVSSFSSGKLKVEKRINKDTS